jgi:hypothetical protein
MNANFEYTSNLEYRVKSLSARLHAFESGEKYTSMKAAFKTQLSEKDRMIRGLRAELASVRLEVTTARHNWAQVFDDLEKEHSKELRKKDLKLKAMEERALAAERQRDDGKDKNRDLLRELYQVKTELYEEQGKNLKLIAQINRDYENSSIPSSLKPNHKKIVNNREKTGKKPGGQPGHEGHGRRKLTPTNRIDIPAPEKYTADPDFRPTRRTIIKQMINISVNAVVREYATPEFRNVHTGQRVHADFPEGAVNDVNYGGSVKAFAYLLNNRCNVSIEKVSEFLRELTNGELRISTGMINGLSKEFSRKTEADQKKAFADMLLSPVMNVDFTSARVGGKNANVFVCASPLSVMYFAREHKGHEGVKGTPAADCQNILIHDHDLTFYNYGRAHQECLEHVLRCLKDSTDNEPGLRWNGFMRESIREMIHFRNRLKPDETRNPDEVNPEKVKRFEARFDEILKLAEEEYEYEPPGKYFSDGLNLSKKLRKYRDNHLLFLHDIRVPPTNNLSERLLRTFKRKQAQVMTFRSSESLDMLCRCMGTVASLREHNQNLFESVAAIYDRPLCGCLNTQA